MKGINLSNEVYAELKLKAERENETFSEILKELIGDFENGVA